MNSRLKKVLLGAGLVVLSYLLIGNLLHRVLLPMPAPDPATYPIAGDTFASDVEGFEQHILAVRDGWVHAELIVRPGAAGPPLHFHEAFDEVFTVKEGTLHIQVGDEIHQLSAGETLRIPAGTPHKPFNPGTERAVVAGDNLAMPQTFSACLVQLYALLDEAGGISGPAMGMQMSVIDPICDTHLGDVPAPALAITNAFMAPMARLAGYRNYYPERSLHPPGESLSSPVAGGR